jgi:hypothetical protein
MCPPRFLHRHHLSGPTVTSSYIAVGGLQAMRCHGKAAKQRVWKTRFSNPAAIVIISPGFRDMEKFGGAHSTRRTAAVVSLNVDSDLLYHAATFGRSAFAASRARPSAHTVISENNPSNAGVVAGSRGPTTVAASPRRDRPALPGTSSPRGQCETNQPRMVAGCVSRSVLRNAAGSCSPDGSRTRTQRIGTGAILVWYQSAVPVGRAAYAAGHCTIEGRPRSSRPSSCSSAQHSTSAKHAPSAACGPADPAGVWATLAKVPLA